MKPAELRPERIIEDTTGASCDICEREDASTVLLVTGNHFADDVYICGDCLAFAKALVCDEGDASHVNVHPNGCGCSACRARGSLDDVLHALDHAPMPAPKRPR